MTTKPKGVSLDEMMNRLPPSRRTRVEEQAQALIAQHMALRDVRKAMGKTQAAVAAKLGIKQENVARIEKRGDMLLSTLRSYVQALGGDVHLTVELKGHAPVRLEGFGDLGRQNKTAGGQKKSGATRRVVAA